MCITHPTLQSSLEEGSRITIIIGAVQESSKHASQVRFIDDIFAPTFHWRAISRPRAETPGKDERNWRCQVLSGFVHWFRPLLTPKHRIYKPAWIIDRDRDECCREILRRSTRRFQRRGRRPYFKFKDACICFRNPGRFCCAQCNALETSIVAFALSAQPTSETAFSSKSNSRAAFLHIRQMHRRRHCRVLASETCPFTTLLALVRRSRIGPRARKRGIHRVPLSSTFTILPFSFVRLQRLTES